MSASEPRAGTPSISSSTGAHASRFRLPSPSAMFSAASTGPRAARARAARARARSVRGTAEAHRLVAELAGARPRAARIVSSGSYSASASAGSPGSGRERAEQLEDEADAQARHGRTLLYGLARGGRGEGASSGAERPARSACLRPGCAVALWTLVIFVLSQGAFSADVHPLAPRPPDATSRASTRNPRQSLTFAPQGRARLRVRRARLPDPAGGLPLPGATAREPRLRPRLRARSSPPPTRLTRRTVPTRTGSPARRGPRPRRARGSASALRSRREAPGFLRRPAAV